MNSIEKQNVIKYLFAMMNNDDIKYAILRNYERLPEYSGDDIDIYVCLNDLQLFVDDYLNRILSEINWDYKIKYKSDKFLSAVCYFADGDRIEVLQLDFFNSFKWRGIEYIDVNYIQKNIYNYGPYRVVAIGTELAVTAVKEMLGYGAIREKHAVRLKKYYASHKSDFLQSFPVEVRDNLGDLFTTWLLGVKSLTDDHVKKTIRRILITNRLFNYVKFASHVPFQLLKNFLRRKNLVIFLGPDGSGKTTLINNLRIVMDRFYPDNICIYHRRYGILPELKTNRGISSMKGQIKPGQRNEFKRSLLSKLASYFVVLYYSVDFIIGNIVVQKHRIRGSLVLFDRYFFDHFIQPSSRDLIFPWRHIIKFFIAKPSIIIHLKASAVEIYRRKQDLPVAEIDLQNEYIDKFLCDYDCVFKIDSVSHNQNQVLALAFRKLINDLLCYK